MVVEPVVVHPQPQVVVLVELVMLTWFLFWRPPVTICLYLVIMKNPWLRHDLRNATNVWSSITA